MKYIKRLTYMLVLMFSISLLTGCTKDGEVGPTGVNGGVGPQGEIGDKGPKGKDADTEIIEVYSSDWFSYPRNAYIGSGRDWKVIIPAPQITQAVLDKGTVTVYFNNINTPATPFLYKLPMKGTYKSDNKVIAVIRLGEIEIQATYNYASEFRYIISPLN